jgi:hypothetical protein
MSARIPAGDLPAGSARQAGPPLCRLAAVLAGLT